MSTRFPFRILRHASIAAIVVAGLSTPSSSVEAQVIVYPGQQPQPVVAAPAPTYTYAQPTYQNAPPPGYAYQPAPPRSYGSLVGSAALYARIAIGVGSDFFHLHDGSGANYGVTSGAALHTDFALGLRFAYVHALHLDVDVDRGFAPTVSGNADAGGSLIASSIGAGYTNFLRGTGLYLSGGAGFAVSRLYGSYGSGLVFPTATGYTLHARVGYDFPLGPRSHLGAAITVRYMGLADPNYLVWRGASLALSLGFGWY